MAGLNVAEWSPDQVADWLTGLGPTIAQYVEGLRARGLDGPKLLMLRCDDLEYLGMHVIGHQELLLEAVEHLRNFQYELSRECIQQLALKVSVVATSLARQLRHHSDARLETQTLADVARVVHAVKPLVCWLDRWPAGNASLGRVGGGGAWGAGLAERKAALLKLSLEAATCAQRDRFAEQPARAVAAAAATTAAVADYIVQEVVDPGILAGASLGAVSVRQGGRPLGFEVVPSYCGHHQLADIRFGSPAHASGHVHEGDELVQVNGQCVIGWSGAAVRAACVRGAGGELSLRLRRRGARPPALAPPPHTPRAPSRALYVPVRIERYVSGSIMSAEVKGEKEKETSAASSSDESEPLSPPASPSLPLDHTRIYPLKPRAAVQRRHTISCGSPVNKRPNHTIEQFWQQLKEHRRGNVGGSAGVSPEPDDGGVALYARDKAVSYSTGLETSRPRTCLGLSPTPPIPLPPPPETPEEERARGKLDKAHSTPAYDFAPLEPAMPPPIPESPPALAAAPASTPAPAPVVAPATPDVMVHPAEKADQILQFKKSSDQIGEAMTRRGNEGEPDLLFEGSGARDESTTEMILETINIAMMEHRRRSLLEGRSRPGGPADGAGGNELRRSRVSPPSPPSPPLPPAPLLGVLRCVPRPAPPARDPTSPLKPHRPLDVNQISGPLRHLTPHEMVAMRAPPLNPSPQPRPPPPAAPDIVVGAHADAALSPTSAVRGIFPTSKSRSLKKKSSILAKRRGVPARALAARGAAGGVWQRVRARHPAAAPRWARRHLLLAHNLLYAYRTPECSKADCMIYLEGFTVCAAGEVKSRAHAFKVYHTGTCVYFASDTRDGMLHWIQLIHRATLLPSLLSHMDSSNHFSETDYSDTESDNESPEKRCERDRDRDRERDKDKDKSKFGSLKKLTGRVPRSESQENVSLASTSLDRKYLRFFSRNKPKDDSKPKSKSGTPVPTEQYRSYRRVAPPSPASPPAPPSPPAAPPRPADRPRRIPKPINYIHASNPNLLDFEKSDFVTKPALQPPKQKVTKVQEKVVGLVTLEQFMLQKQAEERRQLAAYSDRVLLGVSAHSGRALDTIVADVVYGEVGAPHAAAGTPISVRGKDGYETIVYPDESPPASASPCVPPSPPRTAPPPPPPDRWRDSLRRNDKVHSRAEASPARKRDAPPASHGQSAATAAGDSWNNNGGETSSGPGVSRLRLMFGGRTHRPHSHSPPTPPRGQYPHLQCPPVFHAETYSLTGAARKPT